MREAAASFTPTSGSAIPQSSASGAGGNGERVKTGTTSTWTVRDPSGTLIAVRIGTTLTSYYPFTDNVASVRALVKADGTVSNTHSYSAYGTTLTASEASGATQPYRYGGGYTDTATGSSKLGARSYDPNQGRFTQFDPSGRDPHYAYANLSPITVNDPTGLANGCGRQDHWREDVPDVVTGLFINACNNHDNCYNASSPTN